MIADAGRRLVLGARFAALAALLVAAIGTAGRVIGTGGPLGGVWLTTTLGPTAYVILAHPRSVTSRLRNGLIGHGCAIGSGLLALAMTGLWHAPSVAALQTETTPRVTAQALALGLTLLLLTLAGAHHAPSGATALLVSSGLAGPGPDLGGLVVGLAVVLTVAPLLARLPGERRDTARMDADETPMG